MMEENSVGRVARKLVLRVGVVVGVWVGVRLGVPLGVGVGVSVVVVEVEGEVVAGGSVGRGEGEALDPPLTSTPRVPLGEEVGVTARRGVPVGVPPWVKVGGKVGREREVAEPLGLLEMEGLKEAEEEMDGDLEGPGEREKRGDGVGDIVPPKAAAGVAVLRSEVEEKREGVEARDRVAETLGEGELVLPCERRED